jgi:hypothetical protein
MIDHDELRRGDNRARSRGVHQRAPDSHPGLRFD